MGNCMEGVLGFDEVIISSWSWYWAKLNDTYTAGNPMRIHVSNYVHLFGSLVFFGFYANCVRNIYPWGLPDVRT